MKMRSILILATAVFCTGCKEFIEPSIEKKQVELLAPADGTEGIQYAQTFWWEPIEDALKYRLQVVTPSFDRTARLLIDTLIETNKFNYTLDPGNYEWRVRAENGSTQTPYTKAAFVIYPGSIKQQQVQLQAPLNNALTNVAGNVFRWLKIFGADKYILQIDTNSFIDEDKLFLNKTIPGQEYSVTFERDKLYQWRVKAKNDTAESKWSTVQNITFDKTPPAKVILTSPANNQASTKPVALSWEAALTAKKYQLYLYKTESKTAYSSKYPVTVTTTSYSFTEGLSGEKIYWEVRALDEVGNVGQASDLRSFVIQ